MEQETRCLALAGIGDSWRRIFSDPRQEWRPGAPLWELARSWGSVCELPEEVEAALDGFVSPSIVAAVPKYIVETAGHSGKTDLFVLIRHKECLTALHTYAVRPSLFIPTFRDIKTRNPELLGRTLNEIGLCEKAATDAAPFGILQRCLEAVADAERMHIESVALVFQSFGNDHDHFERYRVLARLFGQEVEPGKTCKLTKVRNVTVHVTWVPATEDHFRRCCFREVEEQPAYEDIMKVLNMYEKIMRNPKKPKLSVLATYDLFPDSPSHPDLRIDRRWPESFYAFYDRGVFIVYDSGFKVARIGKASVGESIRRQLGSLFRRAPQTGECRYDHWLFEGMPRYVQIIEVPRPLACEAAGIYEFLMSYAFRPGYW